MKGFSDIIKNVHNARVENNLSLIETAEILEKLAENYRWRSKEKLSEEVREAIKEKKITFLSKRGGVIKCQSGLVFIKLQG